MQDEIKNKLIEQEEKLQKIYISVEKTRKYFLVVMWITVIALVLPLIMLAFAIPSFLDTYLYTLNSL